MSNNWTLIYETDASGSQVDGNLKRFSRAVFAGADVKILYSPRADNWWSRNCSSINVTRSGDKINIAAIFMEAADTRSFSSGTGLEFEEPFALEYHIYNTTGVRVRMKFNYQDHKPMGDDTDMVAMRWFVKDYNVPFLDLPVEPFEREFGFPPAARPG